jgi:hypothetical protein
MTQKTMKKTKSLMFTFFGIKSKISTKLKLGLYHYVWHYFVEKMSDFINTKVFFWHAENTL